VLLCCSALGRLSLGLQVLQSGVHAWNKRRKRDVTLSCFRLVCSACQQSLLDLGIIDMLTVV
jgi:hypothetical protein